MKLVYNNQSIALHYLYVIYGELIYQVMYYDCMYV